MNKIPPRLRSEMALNGLHTFCYRHVALHDHICSGRITWEHVFIHGGKQVQTTWAIISLCDLVHQGGRLNKEINEWISLNLATEEELLAMSKAINYIHKRKHLNLKYGYPQDLIDFIQNVKDNMKYADKIW